MKWEKVLFLIQLIWELGPQYKEKLFNQQVAVLSALMVAFYPDIILWTYPVRVETLFIFLIALLFWILLRNNTYEKRFNAVFVGILLGLIVLTRLTFIFFVPFLIIWLYLIWRVQKKNLFTWLLIVTFSFLLTILPWAIRNFIVFNVFTVMTDEIGAIIISFTTSIPHPYYMIESSN
ncbi:MAG: glycosyltransferase family 39 protein, partial [Candidatus Omnitrophica bacterium]|nr:glycosyltransferase family 39 protein [Candidatus Omnitrophota bacterium]